MHAVKYGFVVTIECATDVGHRIIASAGLPTPNAFAEVFSILSNGRVIESDFGASMEDPHASAICSCTSTAR